MPRKSLYTKYVNVNMTQLLYSELSAEAWESGLELRDYIRGLLSGRGKWARAVGKPGGYLIGEVEKPPRRRTD